MKISIVTKDKKYEATPQPVEKRVGDFAVAILNYDMVWSKNGKNVTHISRPTLNDHPQRDGEDLFGLPDTLPLTDYADVLLNQKISKWMHEIMCKPTGIDPKSREAIQSWYGMMHYDRCYTNKSGTGMPDEEHPSENMYRDWIGMTDLNKSDMKFATLMCAGGVVKIVGETTKYAAKIPHWIFEAVNPNDYMNTDPIEEWWKFHRPINSVRIQRKNEKGKWDGTYHEYISIPFSFYRENALLPIFAPPGKKVNLAPKSRFRVLSPDEPLPDPVRRLGGM